MTTSAQAGLERFDRFVRGFEDRPWSVGRLAALLAGIIALRNLLEITVANNPAPSLLALLTHYPLAYVGPFLALTLTLAAWAGVRPTRVARLMVLAWTLTLLPPLADLLLHPGSDRPVIAYLQADPVDIPYVWARFFDPRIALVGTTSGIRLETFAAVALGAFYVWLRSRGVLRALSAAVSIYLVSLSFFTLPLLLQGFFDSILQPTGKEGLYHGQGMFIRANLTASSDATATLWLTLVVLMLASLWARLERRHAETAEPDPAPAPGAAMPSFLVFAFLSGLISAAWIHRPIDKAIVLVPWDVLSLATAITAIVLASRFAIGHAPRDPLLRGVTILVLLALPAALGAPAVLGMAAAAGALVPFGAGLVSRRGALAAALRALLCSLAAYAAVHGGYALLEGVNSAARLPFRVAIPPVVAALLIALFPAHRRAAWKGAWLAAAVAAGGLSAVAFRAQDAPLLALFIVATSLALAAATMLLFSERWLRSALLPVVRGALLGTWALVVLVLALNQAPVRGALSEDARCVARLELLRGHAYEKTDEWKSARVAFERALVCSPDYVPALQALGIGHGRQSARPERGLPYLERALELEPDDPRNLNNLAVMLLNIGRPAEALELLERSVPLDPRGPIARFHVARALDDLGRDEDALEAWRDYLDAAWGRDSEAASRHYARERIRALRRQSRATTP